MMQQHTQATVHTQHGHHWQSRWHPWQTSSALCSRFKHLDLTGPLAPH